MQVESIQFYDVFDNYLNVSAGLILNQEFNSIHELAELVRKCVVAHPTATRCFCFLNNWRYLYVTEKSYDVHYHQFFN